MRMVTATAMKKTRIANLRKAQRNAHTPEANEKKSASMKRTLAAKRAAKRDALQAGANVGHKGNGANGPVTTSLPLHLFDRPPKKPAKPRPGINWKAETPFDIERERIALARDLLALVGSVLGHKP